MKRWQVLTVVLVAVVSSGTFGFWLGFRDGWSRGVAADSGPRGALAVAGLKAIEADRLDNVRLMLESDVDNGLMGWDSLSHWPLLPAVKVLVGEDRSTYETYIRRLAQYRKTHPSPFADPAIGAEFARNLAEVDPAEAAAVHERHRRVHEAIDAVVRRYAP